MIKIGLTGNIASGKSEIEKIISKLGYKVLDLDKVSHMLYDKPEIKEEILKNFKTIDRKEISNIVFSNKSELKKIENIIHPRLKDFILDLNDELVFVSGALLFETGFNELFDKIIFVDSYFETRLKRLMKRNNFSKEEALLRLNSQNINFKNKADFIIENNSTIFDLEKQVAKIIEKIKE